MSSLVNVETGELVEVSREERTAVARLTTAIAALTDAVEFMPIADVVSIKAQVATIQTATKELGMSQEAQELAAEAVRRAEWSLRRATKKGQESGEVASQGRPQSLPTGQDSAPSPASYFGSHKEYADASAMGELEPHEFNEVLDEAKAEGNMSRANVAAKAREKSGRSRPIPRPEAERSLNLLAMYAEKAAREARNLTPDQIRRIKPKADLWTVVLRKSVEVLQDLLTSLTEEK